MPYWNLVKTDQEISYVYDANFNGHTVYEINKTSADNSQSYMTKQKLKSTGHDLHIDVSLLSIETPSNSN